MALIDTIVGKLEEHTLTKTTGKMRPESQPPDCWHEWKLGDQVVKRMIHTTHGLLDEHTLLYSEGVVDDEREYTTFQQWNLGDEIVKRSVQIQLKHGLSPFIQVGEI